MLHCIKGGRKGKELNEDWKFFTAFSNPEVTGYIR